MRVVDKCVEDGPQLQLTDLHTGTVFECWAGSTYRGTYIKTGDGGATWLENGIHYTAQGFGGMSFVALPNATLVKKVVNM